MKTGKALIYSSYGKPLEVLGLEAQSLRDPGPGEVLLKVLAAPVHPSDFGMILGKYGRLKALPAVAGREGVAEIVAVGADVDDFSPGDRVTVPDDMGSWQEMGLSSAKGLFRVPSDIPVEMAAMATINPPTAWRILRDAGLNDGDWVIQNAANSAVGLHVIEMARHLGLKTVNVVRREELIQPLLDRGADHVVLEESGYDRNIKDLTGGQPVMLALNSIGGESAIRLVNALSPGGSHVTIGAMQFEAVRFPTRALIFNNVTLRGFWMDQWFRNQSETRVQIMFDKIFDLMRKGQVTATVSDSFRLEDYKEAVEAAGNPRLGKVMFRMD